MVGWRCLSIRIPASDEITNAVMYQLTRLSYLTTWEQVDPLAHTAESTADAMRDAIHNMENKNCMIGQTITYLGQTPPPGILPLEGQTLDRDDYMQLWAVIDPAYKTASTVNLPDMRGHFAVGAGQQAGMDNYEVGQVGGSERVGLTVDQMPAHTHTYTPPTANVDLEAPGAPDIFAAGLGFPTQTGSAGGNQQHENRPPYVVMRWGIVYR